MDALHALNGQLDFIRSFYLPAKSPFKVLLRKHNIPYHETCDGESPDDFDKWAAARKGLEVLGQCSLSLVHKALFGQLGGRKGFTVSSGQRTARPGRSSE